MNEQAMKQIAMAKKAIKANTHVVNLLLEAEDALHRALSVLAENVTTLEMLKVTEETIAIGAINQLFENVNSLLD